MNRKGADVESVVKLPSSIAPGAREDVQAHIVLDRKVLLLTLFAGDSQ